MFAFFGLSRYFDQGYWCFFNRLEVSVGDVLHFSPIKLRDFFLMRFHAFLAVMRFAELKMWVRDKGLKEYM
jgi:hypothetical protein